jgi:hypothetical protein
VDLGTTKKKHYFQQPEVFPKRSQKLFFPKTSQKFKSFQSLSGASNLQSVNGFVFTGPSSTMTFYFGKDSDSFTLFSGCVSSTPSKNDFLSDTTLKPRHVMFQKLFFRVLLTLLHHDMSFVILEKPFLTEFLGGHV